MSNTDELTNVADKSFDYVIAGGGTAGLTLAARLSEDHLVTVLVLEAGRPSLDDPNILIPNQSVNIFGDPNYDWSFSTVKQPHSNDREFTWTRGKVLGGSSALNLCAWVKPSAADVNAIERLGNPGWGWESYVKYSKRSETFNAPADQQGSSFPVAFNKNSRGAAGPIQTSLPPMVYTPEAPFQQSLHNIGVKFNENPYDGDNTGVWIANLIIDPRTSSRSYAATGYYQPHKDRPNLTVLTQATVARVLFADSHAPREGLIATGVEFRCGAENSLAHIVHARKEVILSAGAIKSPQLLELSGIGGKDVLDQLGIDVKIDLPGVGENVQEHTSSEVKFELKDVVDRAEHNDLRILVMGYFPLSVAHPTEITALVSIAKRTIGEQKVSGNISAGLAEQYEHQLEALKDENVPDLQFIAHSEGIDSTSRMPETQRVAMILNHPLSRGTIHAASQDPMQQPEINPHYFENDFDLEMLVQHLKFVRVLAEVEPWKSTLGPEVGPSATCTTDEAIREYIKNTLRTTWHTIGSCSMMPREKQGVVDPELKVYGTQNLRVVDMSILPLHMATHTQATAYVIGEKAADIICGIH